MKGWAEGELYVCFPIKPAILLLLLQASKAAAMYYCQENDSGIDIFNKPTNYTFNSCYYLGHHPAILDQWLASSDAKSWLA